MKHITAAGQMGTECIQKQKDLLSGQVRTPVGFSYVSIHQDLACDGTYNLSNF